MKQPLLLVVFLLTSLFAFAQAPDTLKHYDIFSTQTIDAPLEIQGVNPWGYRYGHGQSGLHEFAEKYDIGDSMRLVGILVYLSEFADYSTTSNENAWLAWYMLDGPKPNAAFEDSIQVPFTNVNTGLFAPHIGMFSEDDTIIVSDSIFVSFGFPTYPYNNNSPSWTPPTDTFAVYRTDDQTNDPSPGTYFRNAIRYPDAGNWEDPNVIFMDEINFLISPIVDPVPEDDPDPVSNGPMISRKGFSLNKLYPNPATDRAVVEFSLDNNEDIHFILMDMSGKVLNNWSRSFNSGDSMEEIDLSQLSSGNYILAMKSNSGVVSSLLSVN